jgi:aminoglycoside 6'-N-acetyltransferase
MRTPDVPLVGRSSIVRPATTDDADLLVAWHEDPDVSRYWDGKTFTRAQMMLHLVRADVDPYVVMDDDVPVGYIQVWFEEDVPGTGGLDMFLIPPARDRGLGPDAARTLARWLLTNGIVHRLTADPYLWNERAVAAWKKAGFEPIEERGPDDEHANAWLLMEFDPRR